MNGVLKNKIKQTGIILGIILIFSCFIILINLFYTRFDNNVNIYLNNLKTLAYNPTDYVYLSDIDYIESIAICSKR